MSWTGKLLLARAALKAFFDFKAARSNAAAAPTASHEVEVSAKACCLEVTVAHRDSRVLSGSQTSTV